MGRITGWSLKQLSTFFYFKKFNDNMSKCLPIDGRLVTCGIYLLLFGVYNNNVEYNSYDIVVRRKFMSKKGLLVRLKTILEDGTIQEWECVVNEVLGDRLSLHVPKDNPQFMSTFKEGTDISVSVISNSGVYFFDSIVIESGCNSDFTIEYGPNCEIVERRKYKRVFTETKALLERLAGQNIIVTTKDLSGGSFKFIYDSTFRSNEWVNLRLKLPLEKESIRTAGTIVKMPHLLENEYLLLFNQIRDDERQRIIDTCEEVQLLGLDAEFLGLSTI